MSPNEVVTPMSTSVAVALIVPRIIETLKRSQWFPWLDIDSTTAARLLSAASAVCTQAGIAFSWDGAGTITITGVTAAAIAQLVLQSWAQYSAHQLVYHASIRPEAKGE